MRLGSDEFDELIDAHRTEEQIEFEDECVGFILVKLERNAVMTILQAEMERRFPGFLFNGSTLNTVGSDAEVVVTFRLREDIDLPEATKSDADPSD